MNLENYLSIANVPHSYAGTQQRSKFYEFQKSSCIALVALFIYSAIIFMLVLKLLKGSKSLRCQGYITLRLRYLIKGTFFEGAIWS